MALPSKISFWQPCYRGVNGFGRIDGAAGQQQRAALLVAHPALDSYLLSCGILNLFFFSERRHYKLFHALRCPQMSVCEHRGAQRHVKRAGRDN